MARYPSTGEDQDDRKDFAHVDVVTLGGVLGEEAAVEIVDQIRGAPVQLSADGGHERGEKGRDHQAAQGGRKKIAQDHNVALLMICGEGFTGREAAVRRI